MLLFHNRFSFVLFLRSKAPRYFSFSQFFIFAFYRRFFHVFSYHTISDELLHSPRNDRWFDNLNKTISFAINLFAQFIWMDDWSAGLWLVFIFILKVDSIFNTSNYEQNIFFLVKLWDIEFARKKTSNDKASWFHWKLRLFFRTDRQITSFYLKIFITNFLVKEMLRLIQKRNFVPFQCS